MRGIKSNNFSVKVSTTKKKSIQETISKQNTELEELKTDVTIKNKQIINATNLSLQEKALDKKELMALNGQLNNSTKELDKVMRKVNENPEDINKEEMMKFQRLYNNYKTTKEKSEYYLGKTQSDEIIGRQSDFFSSNKDDFEKKSKNLYNLSREINKMQKSIEASNALSIKSWDSSTSKDILNIQDEMNRFIDLSNLDKDVGNRLMENCIGIKQSDIKELKSQNNKRKEIDKMLNEISKNNLFNKDILQLTSSEEEKLNKFIETYEGIMLSKSEESESEKYILKSLMKNHGITKNKIDEFKSNSPDQLLDQQIENIKEKYGSEDSNDAIDEFGSSIAIVKRQDLNLNNKFESWSEDEVLAGVDVADSYVSANEYIDKKILDKVMMDNEIEDAGMKNISFVAKIDNLMHIVFSEEEPSKRKYTELERESINELVDIMVNSNERRSKMGEDADPISFLLNKNGMNQNDIRRMHKYANKDKTLNKESKNAAFFG